MSLYDTKKESCLFKRQLSDQIETNLLFVSQNELLSHHIDIDFDVIFDQFVAQF